ncbi:MAG TPA: hydrogenase maturation nickel metallochaperone HypA [Kineosporiaceae bacterium]|nr:hydrogenase maturation nickel metallochaperone HypA [Kineosporiaceae bacterium]
MHELSICDSIAKAAVRHAAGRPVLSVSLRVGALRQVVPETLAFCWPLAATHPLLAGSQLEIEAVPAAVECRECGARTELDRFAISCPACDGPVDVVSGEELLMVSLEVADPEPGTEPGTDPAAPPAPSDDELGKA